MQIKITGTRDPEGDRIAAAAAAEERVGQVYRLGERIKRAIRETERQLARARRYSPEFQDKGLISGFEEHLTMLKDKLEPEALEAHLDKQEREHLAMVQPRKQFITSDEAKPATCQHKKACSDCPWARKALPGWLGSPSADEWVQLAHSDGTAECHALTGAQCAGLAIYRANVCKSVRDPKALKLAADRENVFSSPAEFKAHHNGTNRADES